MTETAPKVDKSPKAHNEGLKGVFHGSNGHGPNQPVVGPRTGEQHLREALKVSMEVPLDQLMRDAADHLLSQGAEIDGLRLTK